jgi:nucleoid DNA-binding protein
MADNFKKSIFDKATSVPGMAKGAGDSALGGIGSLLGAGIGAGGSLVDTLGSLAGVSAEKLESLPVVGDIIKTLADKLGMTTSQAAAIVSGALTMLTSKMKRSGSDSMDDIDFDDWDEEFADESEVVSQVAEETGLEEEQVTEGMQEAMKMIADAADEEAPAEE